MPYHSFKGLDLRRRVPFVGILIVVMGFVVITIDPPRVLLAIGLLYAVSGPLERLFGLKGRLSKS
jgi:CDP-diacylglycerol--serine O-phosphatidyltransferase